MRVEKVELNEKELQKLFGIGNGDAALLYIYLRSGNSIHSAAELGLTQNQLALAEAMLRQMGLWEEEKKASFVPGERPAYSENDVIHAMDSDGDFRSLYGEIQRLLGKHLNTEELKILLGFRRYLGLSNDVISVLVCYCKERARQRGSLRNPSLRTIEKEAYAWAERGIDSVEAAAAFIQAQNVRNSRLHRLMNILQIRGRNLTQSEEKYAVKWLEMGFDDAAITMAYERTCLNTGGMSWPYMNKILTRWHDSGWKTGEQVANQDHKSVPKGASGQLGQAELEAIRRVMQGG